MNSMRNSVRAMMAAALLLAAALPGTGFAEVTVTARANPPAPAEGEQFQLIVQVTSTEGQVSARPEMSSPDGVTVQGPLTQQSSEYSVVNGRMTQRSTLTYIYPAYAMTEGTYRFEDIHIVHNGQKIPGGSVEVTVTNQGAQRPAASRQGTQTRPQAGGSAQLVAEFSKETVYRNEQVLLTFSIVSDTELSGEIEFENLDANIFRGFYQQDVTVGPARAETVEIEGKKYIRYEIKRYALFPLSTGELTIKPIVMNLVTGRPSIFDMFGRGRRVRLASKAVTLQVNPLPEAGRPEGFRDAVGSPLRLTATVGRKEVEMGDALSLTITLQGAANFASLPAPLLPQLDDFTVHDPEVDTNLSRAGGMLAGRKTWKYVLVPERAGDLRIGAVRYPVFDPGKEAYEVLTAAEIPLTVLESAREREDRIVLRGAGGRQREVTLEGEDFRYIMTDPGEIEDEGALLVASPRFLALNAVPVVLVVGALLLERRRKRFADDPAYARHVRAPAHAKQVLAEAEKGKQGNGEFDALLSKAVVEFLDMRFGIPARGMLSEELSAELAKRGIDGELAGQVTGFLAELDESRFASPTGAGMDADGRLQRAREIIGALEGVSKR